LITAEDVSYDENDVETGRVRTNLTGGIVYLTVEDADGNIVIQKDSTNIAEIVLRDQTPGSDTEGQSDVYFVEADTAPLSSDPIDKYWFDCWTATLDGREEPIVDRGRFFVDKSTTHISAGPAPAIPTFPASQSPQERSFKFTIPTLGTFWTVTFPGTGMVNATYCIEPHISDLPLATSPVAVLYDLVADRTATDFILRSSGPLEAGTIIDIHARDVA
jgi:hypothetical protein